MAKLRIALLEYSFMLDPDETWSNLHAFESVLAKFFEEYGLEAIVIKSIEGASSKRMMYLRKKEGLHPLSEGAIPKGKKVK